MKLNPVDAVILISAAAGFVACIIVLCVEFGPKHKN